LSSYAKNSKGVIICADDFSDEEWILLKSQYNIGDYHMLCCESPAIPKTSHNYIKFFSHYTEECSTAPETMWHKSIKSLCVQELKNIGINAIEEKKEEKWKADIYFKYNNRIIVFEIQHSQQTLPKYLQRQKVYEDSNIESYWILYLPRFLTIRKAIGNYKLKYEFEGKFPSESISPNIKELPIVYFDDNLIKGIRFFQCSLKEWITAILERKFIFRNHVWRIHNDGK